MKVYIAAPWADKSKMPVIGQRLEANGHSITHTWCDTPAGLSRREQAVLDFHGVKEADIVVVMNTALTEGKSFEQGVAVSFNKPIIAVGTIGEFCDNVFHYLDHYRWVKTLDEAIDVLNTIQWLTSHQEV